MVSFRAPGTLMRGVEARAAAEGTSVSEAWRRVAAAGLGRRVRRPRSRGEALDPQTVRALAELLNPIERQLNRVGVNVNQIARRLNQGGRPRGSDAAQLLAAFADVRKEQERVGALLSAAILTAARGDEEAPE